MYRNLLLTILLMSSTLLLPKSVTAQTTLGDVYSVEVKQFLPEADRVRAVPQGWVTPEDGYFMPTRTGREILEYWKSDHATANMLEQKLNDLLEAQGALVEQLLDKIDELSGNFEKTIKAKNAEIQRAKAPGVVAFIGPVYTTGGEFKIGIGLGLGWKIK